MRGGRTILSVKSWLDQDAGRGMSSPGGGQDCPSDRGSTRMPAVGCLHGGTDRIVRPPLNLDGCEPPVNARMRGGRTILSVKSGLDQNAGRGMSSQGDGQDCPSST